MERYRLGNGGILCARYQKIDGDGKSYLKSARYIQQTGGTPSGML